jgi:hypothetical protein
VNQILIKSINIRFIVPKTFHISTKHIKDQDISFKLDLYDNLAKKTRLDPAIMCTKVQRKYSCRKCYLLLKDEWEEIPCAKAREKGGAMGACGNPALIDRKEIETICDECFKKQKKKRGF